MSAVAPSPESALSATLTREQMAEHASHPMFARIYSRVAEIGERRGGTEHRRKLLTGLQGRVV